MASIIMDFVRAGKFYESFNTIWTYTAMDGVLSNSPFHIVMASDCDDVFENNIDNDGCLDIRTNDNPNGKVTVDTNFKVKVPLEWRVGINNSRDVAISDNVILDVGEDHHDLKGVFFTVDYNSKNYVIAYMLLPYYLIVTNKVTFPKDTVLVSVE